MAGWNKSSDANRNGSDDFTANNVPYRFKSSSEPFNSGDTTKRNVISTNKGWVRRHNYTDTHGNARTKDETVVAIGGLDSTTGNPHVVEIYVSTGNTSNTSNVYVVFSEPVYYKGSANNLQIALANTVSGNAHVATALANGSDVINANNTLVFKTVDAFPGTYFIHANTIVATSGAANVNSLNTGGESANLTISGAVSNATGTFTL